MKKQKKSIHADFEVSPELSDLKVLVVDDNKTNCNLLNNILEKWKMSIEIAENAVEALEKLYDACENNKAFALALIDYHIPEIDGLTLAEKIRKNKKLFDKTVLLMLLSISSCNRKKIIYQISENRHT